MTDKYYVVTEQDFAKALLWATGQSFMKFDDRRREGGKIYSFVNTKEIQLAAKQLLEIRRELRKHNK